MPLTQRRAPEISGVALIGGTLSGVDGEISPTDAVAPFVSSDPKFQQSADGSDPWTDLANGQALEVTAALAGLSVRYQHTVTDSSDPAQTITLSSAAITIGTVEQVFFDCTLGSVTQTSYICVDTANALLQTVPQSPGVKEWLASSDNNAKKRLLNLATQILDSLCWNGQRCSCDQKLQWPRQVSDCTCELATCNMIPFDVQMATAYLAAWMSTKEDYAWNPGGGTLVPIGGGGGSGGGSSGNNDISGLEPFSRVQIGPIEVEMKADAEFASGKWGWEYLPAYVQSLLWRWLCSDGAGGPGGSGATFRQGNVGRPSVARIHELSRYRVPGKFWLRNGKVLPRHGTWSDLP